MSATPLEFMDLPLGQRHPIVWTINTYDKPTGRHYDIHAGIEIGIVLAGSSRRIYDEHAFVATPGEVWLAGLWEPHGMQVVRPRTRHLVMGVLPEFWASPIRWRSATGCRCSAYRRRSGRRGGRMGGRIWRSPDASSRV